MREKAPVRQAVHRYPILLLLVSALAAVVSVGTVLRAYAMPVEARSSEPWYSYQSSLAFDFVAHVQPGQFYSHHTVRPEQLVRTRLPVDPPTYRRILLSKFTDSVEILIPYRYEADRPAPLKAHLRVDGLMMMPGVWQKPYPLVERKALTPVGSRVEGVERFSIPVKSLLAEMEATRVNMGLSLEPLEIHILPVLEIQAEGLPKPFQLAVNPEFKVVLRASTVEVEDPREVKADQTLSETRVVPITVNLLGLDVKVGVLRQISLYSLIAFLSLAILLVWLRRRKPDSRTILQRLGSNLISVRSFELQGEAAIADVRTARELVQIQVQTERPVIRVGNTYYLLDGTICYRYHLSGEDTTTD